MKNIKTTITGAVTALFGLAAVLATQPDLTNFLPEQTRVYVLGVCGIIAAVSHVYGQQSAADAQPSTPTRSVFHP